MSKYVDLVENTLLNLNDKKILEGTFTQLEEIKEGVELIESEYSDTTLLEKEPDTVKKAKENIAKWKENIADLTDEIDIFCSNKKTKSKNSRIIGEYYEQMESIR
jgi:hypothetical protein